MPNAQVLQPQAPGNIMATGLTPVENALLSDEEKQRLIKTSIIDTAITHGVNKSDLGL